MKKYQVVLKFRNGNTMEVFIEKVIARKGDNTFYRQLHFDDVPVATLSPGSPNFDQHNSYRLYNASPLPILYDMMPEDWDKTETSLKIIDEIFVNTLPQEKDDV
jgi:hypothetical protein